MKHFANIISDLISDFFNSEKTLAFASFAGETLLFLLKIAAIPFVLLFTALSTILFVITEALVALQMVFWFVVFYSIIKPDLFKDIGADNFISFLIQAFAHGAKSASVELLSYPAGSLILAAGMAFLFRNLVADTIRHFIDQLDTGMNSLFFS